MVTQGYALRNANGIANGIDCKQIGIAQSEALR
jgi:hypothetical protein